MTLDLDAYLENAQLMQEKRHPHITVKVEDFIELVELAQRAEVADSKR
jgi:hypothetical protein